MLPRDVSKRKPMPSQFEKLQSYAAHLLDDMILLREKYALLEPMMSDQDVIESWGTGARARGFRTLRMSLLLSCAQDIAKIATDKDRRVPSITNLVDPLENPELRSQFREHFSVIPLHVAEEDEDVAALLQKIELKEEAERREEFDALCTALQRDWKELKKSPVLSSFRTIRDKITAHSEVRRGAEEYKRVEIGSLNLKWRDVGAVIEELQALVNRINLVVRASSFSWRQLDEQLQKASVSFWEGGSVTDAQSVK
jgi:hypothetical protein